MSERGLEEAPLISSTRNPKVQRVRKLHRRSQRDEERAFILEGVVVVREALGLGAALEELYFTTGVPEVSEVVGLAGDAGVRVTAVTERVMEAMSGAVTPQGLLGVARMPPSELEDMPPRPTLILVLAGVQDPGNAGTLLRSSVAAGADATIFLKGCVDPFGPKVVRASSSAIFRARVGRDIDPRALADRLAQGEVVLVGTAASAEHAVEDADLTRPVALVVGSESGGIPPEVKSLLSEEVSIRMPGSMESLNAAVAGSIVLFEAVRQRRERQG